MAFSLFEYIGIGLATAIVLIPIARWFWKWFDKPSKDTVEYLQKQQEDVEEKAMWAQIEAKIEAEQVVQNKLTTIAQNKIQTAGKSLDQERSSSAWETLGVDEPLEPVKRIISEKVITGNNEPDWELVEKIQNLSQPNTEVPEAPDLDRLEREKTVEPGWADDW